MSRSRFVRVPMRGTASGFSMIEVLVALLVLALGLLGFALLQTMNLRYTQSAQYRTQATNLAYDLLDQMRANRFQAAWFGASGGATFDAGEVDPQSAACQTTPTGALTIDQSITRWQCQVVRTLGSDAYATVDYADSIVTVDIIWRDQRWDRQDPTAETTFQLVTRL